MNLDVEKIINHERLRNDAIRFLCKWEEFLNENATFRDGEDFQSLSYGIKIVNDYLLRFGESLEELITWTEGTEWMEDVLEEWKKHEEGNEGECRDIILTLYE